jgi:hypothetical protein
LASAEGLEILWIKKEYGEPVTVYLVLVEENEEYDYAATKEQNTIITCYNRLVYGRYVIFLIYYRNTLPL